MLNYSKVSLVLAALQAGAMAQTGWFNVASTGPGPRQVPLMAFDSSRGKTVLYGGYYQAAMADTWEWDGTTWAQVATIGPAARVDSAMAYDSLRAKSVLYGGSAFADTWEWDGASWTQRPVSGPGARFRHAMAYDSARGKTVMFGGLGLADTWEWDGATWTQVATTGPGIRQQHAMSYDSLRRKVVLFGGYDGVNYRGDTWEWDGTQWSLVSSSGPGVRLRTAMSYDTSRNRTVMYGGFNGSWLLDDTWEWDGSTWVQVATAGPGAPDGHAMAYDSLRSRSVLYGRSATFGLTWEWSAVAGSAATYGSGCGNPSLVLSEDPSHRPAIGATARAAIAGIPNSLSFVALGWSRTNAGPFQLPFPLAFYGMPGCAMLQSAEVAAQPTTATASGSATYGLSLPGWTGLIGLHVYLQGWAPAPGANPGGVIVSNGLDWTIGY